MTKQIKRFDIILVDFGNNIGSEQDGIRPAVVIQNDKGNEFSSCTIVMPITSKKTKNKIPTHTPLNKGRGTGLHEDSIVLGECMRQISKQRIIKILGSVSDLKDQNAIKTIYYNNFGV